MIADMADGLFHDYRTISGNAVVMVRFMHRFDRHWQREKGDPPIIFK